MYRNDLDFSTDSPMRVELLFENNAGNCHFPSAFGLTLYYVPELVTPRSDASGDEQKMQALLDKKEIEKQKEKEKTAAVNPTHEQDPHQEADALVDDEEEEVNLSDMDSEMAASEKFELELKEHWKELQKEALYGYHGPGFVKRGDPPAYRTETAEVQLGVMEAQH